MHHKVTVCIIVQQVRLLRSRILVLQLELGMYILGSTEGGGQESLPPVGVFWDIENCAVPSGRSAATVVQRLRERFFQGHREAEFICVCDISKENKAVIQELNNCQVHRDMHVNRLVKHPLSFVNTSDLSKSISLLPSTLFCKVSYLYSHLTVQATGMNKHS